MNRSAHLAGAFGLLLATGVFASAQNAPVTPAVSHPSASAVSSRLSDLPESEGAKGKAEKETHRHQQVPPHESATDKNDDALQTTIHRDLNVNQQPSFPGVGTNGFIPPDPNIAVGRTLIVQAVNAQIGVFDKASGAMLTGYPKTLSSLWAPLGGDCATQNAGDPIAQYDAVADRWLITQLGSLSPPFSQCIAVSQSSDPTGQYNLYAYSFGNNLNDYAKFGVWPTSTNSAYLSTANLFTNGTSFVGAALCAYDRAAMLSGASAPTALCYTIPNDGGFLPSDLDGLTPPPAGSPGYFLNFETLSTLRLYLFAPDFANPINSTLSAPPDINVSPFNMACGGATCIPQPGTSNQLDSLADRLMYRLAYRNFGDHEAIVVNHSVTSGASVGVRWYELRGPFSSGTPNVYQQGTFAPDSDYRWMGSIAVDKNGDIALGYSTSSTTTYPAVRFTGRTPDTTIYPLGTLAAETTLQVGGGSQTGYTRWGDYTALRIDPSDDTTFWYTNEYYSSTSSGSWQTLIGSFQIVPAAQDFSLSTNPSSLTVTPGSSASSQVAISSVGGFSSSVSLSVSGCPASTTCNLPNSATPPTNGSTSVTLSINNTSGTAPGTYTITISGSSGTTNHSTSVSLTVAASLVLTSIAVTPANPSASVGTTVQFTATGTYSDNSTQDITSSVTWGSSSTTAATINASGLATAQAQGATTITATSGSTAGTATLTVIASAPDD